MEFPAYFLQPGISNPIATPSKIEPYHYET